MMFPLRRCLNTKTNKNFVSSNCLRAEFDLNYGLVGTAINNLLKGCYVPLKCIDADPGKDHPTRSRGSCKLFSFKSTSSPLSKPVLLRVLFTEKGWNFIKWNFCVASWTSLMPNIHQLEAFTRGKSSLRLKRMCWRIPPSNNIPFSQGLETELILV